MDFIVYKKSRYRSLAAGLVIGAISGIVPTPSNGVDAFGYNTANKISFKQKDQTNYGTIDFVDAVNVGDSTPYYTAFTSVKSFRVSFDVKNQSIQEYFYQGAAQPTYKVAPVWVVTETRRTRQWNAQHAPLQNYEAGPNPQGIYGYHPASGLIKPHKIEFSYKTRSLELNEFPATAPSTNYGEWPGPVRIEAFQTRFNYKVSHSGLTYFAATPASTNYGEWPGSRGWGEYLRHDSDNYRRYQFHSRSYETITYTVAASPQLSVILQSPITDYINDFYASIITDDPEIIEGDL